MTERGPPSVSVDIGLDGCRDLHPANGLFNEKREASMLARV